MKSITLNIEGQLPLKRQMQLLAMPKALRRRLLNKVAKKVISHSKKRVRSQTDLKGQAFAKHSKGRKRKMLARLSRQLKVTQLTGAAATIGFNNKVLGKIAADHQFGSSQTMNKDSFKSSDTAAKNYHKPATRKQARALRQANYRVGKKKGRKGKKPSLKWVTSHLTIGQAGVIIKTLRLEAGERLKNRWTTKLPARSFLGATAGEVSQHVESIFKQMKQEVAYVAR